MCPLHMALRMSRVLGRSAESWLAMQDSDDHGTDRGITVLNAGRGAPGFAADALPFLTQCSSNDGPSMPAKALQTS
jgi:hypothetical protein